MESRRKRERERVWWSNFTGYKFIGAALCIQLFMLSYMLVSYSTPPVVKQIQKEATLNPHLLFIAISSPRLSFDQRQAVRDTWLKLPLPPKVTIKYKFVVGSANCPEGDSNCQLLSLEQENKINNENEEYKDILRVAIPEGKETSISEVLWETYLWLSENLEFKYFIKLDHDTFLKLDMLATELSKQPMKKAFWSGFVWKQQRPVFASDTDASIYALDHLPPYAASKTFIMSSDVVDGLAEAKPSVFLPDVGQSLAVWLLPFNVPPSHDARYQAGNVCRKELFTKTNLDSFYMTDYYNDLSSGVEPCLRYTYDDCPICYDCDPLQPHWKLEGIECERNGAYKVSNITAQPTDPTNGVLAYLPLLQCNTRNIEDVVSPLNIVKDSRSFSSKNWEMTGNVTVSSDALSPSDTCVALGITGLDDIAASFVTQEIVVGQTLAEPLVISGWSRALRVVDTMIGDYCILADFSFTDGTKWHAFTIDFAPGTHDWQYGVKIFEPPRPIARITLRLMLRMVTGTVWFDNVSIRTLNSEMCDLKHRSSLFGAFRPTTLPDFGSHLENQHIVGGALPREVNQGMASGREGLLDSHLHSDIEEHTHEMMPDLGKHFVLIWTSPVNTFQLRNRRVIESIFFHHPNAHVRVYSNVLPLHFFHEFNSAGYDVQVTRYELEQLTKGLPGSSWVEKLERWEKGDYFYYHLSDFLRFIILYRLGGIYTDLDSILLRPVDVENVVVAEICGSGGCSQYRDSTIKSKYYVPTGFMSFTANHTLLLNSLRLFETNYDPRIRHSGSLYLSSAYSELASSSVVQRLAMKFFYPIPENEIVKYFAQDNPDRWNTISAGRPGDPYAFHFWGTLTQKIEVEEYSLMWRALNDFSISNQRDKSGLQF